MKSSIFEGLRLGARSQPTSLADLLTSVAALDADGRAAISAALTAGDEPAPEPDVIADEPEPADEPAGGEPEAETEAAADAPAPDASAQTFADGVASERSRTKAVLTSEHCAGREPLAAELLDSDLSADRITATLAKAAKGGASPLAALANGGAPDLGAPGAEQQSSRAASDAVWDRIREPSSN